MKYYKIVLIVLSIISIGLFLMITSLEIPTPSKQIIKFIDINDVSVK